MKQKQIRKALFQWFQFGVLLISLTINQTIFAKEKVWESIEVINIDQVPWDDRFRMGKSGSTNGKLLFFNPEGGTLLYVQFNPGWDADGTEAHYHTFHEWGYVLDGSFPLYEFVSPKQKKGTLVQMKEGTFMDRPAYSIHGNRSSAMKRQLITPGSTQLIFYESGKTISLNKKNKSYSDEWKNVEEFFSANFQHTPDTNIMEWEADEDLPGTMVKWLSDHTNMGFTARLRYAPAGWQYESPTNMSYNKDGYRFIYVLSGDMRIEKSPSNNEELLAKKDYLIVQKPNSLWSWGSSEFTDQGVMWLDIEYGKGTIIGQSPIIRSFINSNQ
ncbi:MAG: hypothetical protein P8L75_00930 [Gammaproteobacteria bacterium]|jgi:hypothetical protein|nr:hypothetical protein [Gammaproteobacteria bacterium]